MTAAFDFAVLEAWGAAVGGRTYGHSGEATTDCCRMVEAVLMDLYGRDLVWGEHAALMVMDPAQPFSPVDACVRLGIGARVTLPTPGRWHVCQGWRYLDDRGWVVQRSPNGHTWIWYEPPMVMAPGADSLGLKVEANVRRPWKTRAAWGEVSAPYKAGVELCALVEV